MEQNGKSENKKNKTHTQIEQERRKKEAACYKSLLSYISSDKKLPKLSILEHVTNFIREKEARKLVETENCFITDQEFNQLILDAYKGFIIVLECETGKIIYVSGNIENVLKYQEKEWLDNNIFSFVHPHEMKRVENQLLVTDSNIASIIHTPTGIIRSKYDNSQSNSLKNRRGFLCRIRNKNSNDVSTSFSTVHITGFIQSHNEGTYSQHNYFLATIRLFDNVIKDFSNQETIQYSSRHDKNGKIRLIENELLVLLGYNINEILGRDLREFCIPQDTKVINQLFETLNQKINTENLVVAVQLHFLKKDHEILTFETRAYNFLNAYNNEFEFIVAEHTLNTKVPSYDENVAQLFESNSFGTNFLINNEGPISTETRQENQLNTLFLNDECNVNQPHNFLELFKNQ